MKLTCNESRRLEIDPSNCTRIFQQPELYTVSCRNIIMGLDLVDNALASFQIKLLGNSPKGRKHSEQKKNTLHEFVAF